MSGFIVQDRAGVRQEPLKRLVTIGRSPSNDLVLGSTYASRRHAWVWQQGERFIIEDLGSTHGTLVNGWRLMSPRFLSHNDMVVMGDARLTFVVKADLSTGQTQPGERPQLISSQVYCANCGAANYPRTLNCARCGSSLTSEAGPARDRPEDYVRTSRPITPLEPVVARPFPPPQAQSEVRVGRNAWVLIILLAILAVCLMIIVGMLLAYVLI